MLNYNLKARTTLLKRSKYNLTNLYMLDSVMSRYNKNLYKIDVNKKTINNEKYYLVVAIPKIEEV